VIPEQHTVVGRDQVQHLIVENNAIRHQVRVCRDASFLWSVFECVNNPIPTFDNYRSTESRSVHRLVFQFRLTGFGQTGKEDKMPTWSKFSARARRMSFGLSSSHKCDAFVIWTKPRIFWRLALVACSLAFGDLFGVGRQYSSWYAFEPLDWLWGCEMLWNHYWSSFVVTETKSISNRSKWVINTI
jgi:hypothetical protein